MDEEEKQKIIKEIQFREFNIVEDKINVEKRTVELSFSSETKEVERWFGVEILDHSPNAVRLGRLNDGGALLVNHDRNKQIGVVVSAKIDSDRVGRATVKFGRSAYAEEIFQDVIDGIRTKVSVGYMTHGIVLESSDGDGDVYRITDWEPTEITIASVPADNSVGVGRAQENPKQPQKPKEERTIMTDEEKKAAEKAAAERAAAAAPAPAPQVQVRDMTDEEKRAMSDDIRAKELKRMNDLEGVGDKFKDFNGPELARQAIKEGKDVQWLNEQIMERVGENKPVPEGKIGMSGKEVQRYSFARALHYLANPTDKNAREAAAFEIEVAEAAAERTGKTAQGILVPYDVLVAGSQRDLVAGTATAGGHTVATDLLSGSFIEMLRNRMVLNQLGATVMNGLNGNIAIPRQTSGATAYWVAESGAPTESQQAFDQVTMTPKTVGAFTDYSRKLLLQSSIDVENFIRSDLTKQIGLEIDRAGLYGSGASNQPTGVINTSGINTVDFAAVGPTFAEIVDMETEVAADNADIGSLAYAVNARGRGTLKTTEKASGTAQFIWGADNQVNGYRTEVSNQIAGNGSTTEDHFFANWADLLIGFWSGLDLMVDPYSNSTSGTVRVVALQDVDIAVRHPESFCLGANTLPA